MRRLAVVLVALLIAAVPVVAQSKELSLDDVLRRGPMLSPRGMAGLAWRPGTDTFSYLERTASGAAWVAQAAESGEKVVLAADPEWRAALKAAGVDGVPLTALLGAEWRDDGKAVWLQLPGKLCLVEVSPLAIKPQYEVPAEATAIAFTKDRRAAAFVEDFNIHVRKTDGSVKAVTEGGFRDLTHGVSVSREEFGIKDGLWWSADGRRLAFYREDKRPIDPYPYVDWSGKPAKSLPGRYPMAGRRGSIVSVGVYDTADDSVIWLQSDPSVDEYLTNVTWDLKGERLFVAHVNRAQNEMKLVSYDARTGAIGATLLEEKDPEWIEPESGPIFIPGKEGEFLWFSYRDGRRHLYRHAADGHLMQQVTAGAMDVAAFRGFDAKNEFFFFESSGLDPRHQHLFRGSLAAPTAAVTGAGAGAGVAIAPVPATQITGGRGQHDARISTDGRFVVDRHSNLELPLAVDLLTIDGKVLRRVFECPNPLKDFAMGKEEFFTVKAKDQSDLYGHVIWPPNASKEHPAPVYLYVYGGPHAQIVVDSWALGPGIRNLWMQWLAAQGFVVLRLDNHGTPNRGIEFMQAIHRRLGTVEIDDQLAGLDHILASGLADPTRVAVHGWSYGGFMTLSLLSRAPDRFRCGIAGAPVTDWSFYETGYGERYMDTPEENPEGYKTAAPKKHAKDIKGRLLLVQGTADDTVVWQHTVDFVDACVKAGVDFDYFIYPGQLHGLNGPSSEHFYRKMTSFLKRELGVK